MNESTDGADIGARNNYSIAISVVYDGSIVTTLLINKVKCVAQDVGHERVRTEAYEEGWGIQHLLIAVHDSIL